MVKADEVSREKQAAQATDLIEKEKKQVGSVSWHDVKNFLDYTIGAWGFIAWFVSGSVAAVI